MEPLIERRDQQRIEEIKAHLMDGLDKYANPSTSTERNVGDAENMNEQKPIRSTAINNGDSSSTISSCDDMNVNDFNKISEQIWSDDEQHSDMVNENHDCTNTDEKQINGFEYMRQFLQTWCLTVTKLEPKLVQFVIPTETTEDYFEKCSVPLSDPSDPTDPYLLNKVWILLRKGIDLLSSFHLIHNTDTVHHRYITGEESNENSERTKSANEDNGDCLDRDIQAPTQSKLPTSTTSEDADTTTLSLSLDRLLSQAKRTVQELNLTKLEIPNQPRKLWTKRSINCLEQKWNVCIHDRSGKQQRYPCITWDKLTTDNQKKLFILIQLLSWDGHSHPSNIIVPAGTTIERPKPSNTMVPTGTRIRRPKPSNTMVPTGTTIRRPKPSNTIVPAGTTIRRPKSSNTMVPTGTTIRRSKLSQKRKNVTKTRLTLKNLNITNGHAFNGRNRAVLCPITDEEYGKCAKFIQLIMFSLYKTSEEIADTNDAQDSVENEENEMDIDIDEEDEANSYVEDELRKLSKFRIRLCQRTDNDELEYISNFVDTDLILQCIGSTRVQWAIVKEKVTPKHLCSCGNEKFVLLLNKNIDGKGLVVRLNGEIQGDDKFQVKKNQIFINSCPNTNPSQKCLTVEISKKCILETIKKNKNPIAGLEESERLKIEIPYVKYSNEPHDHINTNVEAFTLAQSNEIEIGETQSLIW